MHSIRNEDDIENIKTRFLWEGRHSCKQAMSWVIEDYLEGERSLQEVHQAVDTIAKWANEYCM